MRPYWVVWRTYYQLLLQYRVAALAGIGTQLVFGLIHVMVFTAFYRSAHPVQPMTLSQVISYIWLIQALFGLVPLRPDMELARMIRDGSIGHELLRPLDLHTFWLARVLGSRLAITTLRGVPMFIVAGGFLGLQTPASWAALGLWVVAMAGAALLSASIVVLLSLLLFWTISGEGVAHLTLAVTWILSGLLIPLPLFPGWAQTALAVLPFRGLIDGPFRIYIGHIPPSEAWTVLVHQLVWILVIVGAGRAVLRYGIRRLVVQGG